MWSSSFHNPRSVERFAQRSAEDSTQGSVDVAEESEWLTISLLACPSNPSVPESSAYPPSAMHSIPGSTSNGTADTALLNSDQSVVERLVTQSMRSNIKPSDAFTEAEVSMEACATTVKTLSQMSWKGVWYLDPSMYTMHLFSRSDEKFNCEVGYLETDDNSVDENDGNVLSREKLENVTQTP